MKLEDGYVPMALWGKDHWSTLGYAETVMVELGGFQVGHDARMRQGRVHYRVMSDQCPRPRRNSGHHQGAVMDPKYGSRLNNDTFVENHDDWHCIQDMVAEGLMGVKQGDLIVPNIEEVEPGAILHLTTLGHEIAGKLRQHKAEGGVFHSFRFTPEPALA